MPRSFFYSLRGLPPSYPVGFLSLDARFLLVLFFSFFLFFQPFWRSPIAPLFIYSFTPLSAASSFGIWVFVLGGCGISFGVLDLRPCRAGWRCYPHAATLFFAFFQAIGPLVLWRLFSPVLPYYYFFCLARLLMPPISRRITRRRFQNLSSSPFLSSGFPICRFL